MKVYGHQPYTSRFQLAEQRCFPVSQLYPALYLLCKTLHFRHSVKKAGHSECARFANAQHRLCN